MKQNTDMLKLGYFANHYHTHQFGTGITNIRNGMYIINSILVFNISYLLVDLSEDNYQISAGICRGK